MEGQIKLSTQINLLQKANPGSNTQIQVKNKKNVQIFWINLKNHIFFQQFKQNDQEVLKSTIVYKQKINNILSQIAQQYSTFRYYNLLSLIQNQNKNDSNNENQQSDHKKFHKIQEICQQIIEQYRKYPLTKRRMVFAFFIENQQQIEQIINKGIQIQQTLKYAQSNNKRIIHKQKMFQQFRLIKGVYITFKPFTKDNKSSSDQQSNNIQQLTTKPRESLDKFELNLQAKLSQQNSNQKIKRENSNIQQHIYTNIQLDSSEIIRDLIKQMQLDFVWVGLLSRLGSDIDQFTDELTWKENFNGCQLGYYHRFLVEVNKKIEQYLKKEQNDIKNHQAQIKLTKTVLQKTFKQISISLFSPQITSLINLQTQQLIQQKFNSRTIINHVTFGDYFHLLLSRNYFNLIYIECPITQRYNRFMKQIYKKFPHLYKVISGSLDNFLNFLFLDDYWYSNYILKCMTHVKFIIDRGENKIDYSIFIQKNYQQIIPPFRPSLDEYFISICNTLKKRGGCVKQAVGAIIVKNKKIIATGVNDTPTDTKHCCNGGCNVCNNSLTTKTQVLSCSCIHAQYCCILEAGIKNTPGSTIYSTKLPCLWCCKLIVQGRISKIVCIRSKYKSLDFHNLDKIMDMLNRAKITVVEFDVSRVFVGDE